MALPTSKPAPCAWSRIMGFSKNPRLMIRATRYQARLGWELDPKTQVRYENAKGEGVIESLSAHERSRELEQIAHEDDGLKVLRALGKRRLDEVSLRPVDASQGR